MGIGIASGGWLDGGPNYGEMRSYFSDPIFYSGGPHSTIDHSQYYPYFGSGIFKDSTSTRAPSREPIALGKIARKLAEERKNKNTSNPTSLGYTNPRQNRMIDPEASPSRKNWTRTMDFAQNKSSLKVYDYDDWKPAQDVQNLY